MTELIARELRESASAISSIEPGQVLRVAEQLIKTFRSKGKVILFGNGGSAADAQHIAAEFSGRYLMERAPLNAIALTNLSSITAIGNDYSYQEVFERQIAAHVQKGDAVIGISTSGNSENVLRAVAKAKEMGAATIGFSGSTGKLRLTVDLALTIPSKKTPHIQEGYIAAAHVICGLVERGLFGRRAVFIDRDDTIAKDVPYCPTPEQLVLFEGVGNSIRRLNEAGFLVIVITNQSGVARGLFSEAKLREIHGKMQDDLAKEGASLDAVYFCPHLPEQGCECRKPGIGMVLQAMEEFDIDLSSSYVVGDSEREMELARRIGAKGVQVSEGFDFNRAVDLILGQG